MQNKTNMEDQEMDFQPSGSTNSTQQAPPQPDRIVKPSEYLQTKHSGKTQTNPQGVSNSFNWVYINGLGERDEKNVSKNDVLTAITYDKTGKYLAVGDQGGRVIIFKYNELKNSRYFDYRYFTEI